MFILIMLFIVVVARFIACFTAYYAFTCCPGGSQANRMTVQELTFEAFAGLIRGSVAFALCTNMGEELNGPNEGGERNKSVVESATLLLVIITTILFGSATNLVSKALLTNKAPEAEGTVIERASSEDGGGARAYDDDQEPEHGLDKRLLPEGDQNNEPRTANQLAVTPARYEINQSVRKSASQPPGAREVDGSGLQSSGQRAEETKTPQSRSEVPGVAQEAAEAKSGLAESGAILHEIT